MTEVQKLAKIKVLKDLYKEYELLAKYNGGIDYDRYCALEMAIKALETVEEFEKAQIITGGRVNGRTYAYKCGLEDGKRKALEQESILDKIRAEIEQTEINGHIRDVECFRAGINVALNVIDKYKLESEGKE